jgi:hypothetical protein
MSAEELGTHSMGVRLVQRNLQNEKETQAERPGNKRQHEAKNKKQKKTPYFARE